MRAVTHSPRQPRSDEQVAIHPWDLDFTWQNGTPGSGNDQFSFTILRRDEFLPGYRNRTHELRDLLLNPEQVGMLIDEVASFIYTPGQPSFVEDNRAMWDLNPETKKNASVRVGITNVLPRPVSPACYS